MANQHPFTKKWHFLRVPARLGIALVLVLLTALTISAQAPTATTGAASGIGSTGATLNGTVNANGSLTTVYFEYGFTEEYGSIWPAPQSPVSGSTATPVTANLILLDPETTYHYRVVATNASGTTYGADMTFTTLVLSGNPPQVATTAATGIGVDSATLNGLVNASGVSTTVSFEWGTDASYGNTVTADQSPVNSGVYEPVSAGLTGLANNTTYHYRIVASNINGTSYGQDVTFAIGTGGTAPTATTNAATGVGTSTATLNGTVNANGAPTIVTFQYGLDTNYGSTAVAPQSPVSGSTDTAVSAAISDLLPNTTYHYRVTAVNVKGTDNGDDMTFTTLPMAPTATTDPASAVGTTTATLDGTVNANGDSTTVTFQYGLDTGYGTTVTADQSPVTGSTDTAVSRAIAGLTNGITYHYRVVAVNAGGTTYGADMTFTAGATAPTATTNAASGLGATTATLNGTVNANNSATTVTFEYGPDTSYGRTVGANPSTVTGSSNTAVSVSLSNLLPGATYHYRVAAVNTGGTTYGADMTFSTLAAPTVATGVAWPVSTSGATLNGTVNANGSSTTVTFEYGTTTAYGTTVTADESPVTGSTPTAVSKAITDLIINTTYHYRVAGQNAQGTSYGADMIFLTSLPAAPTVTTDAATRVMQDGATLNGTINANNAGTTVTFEYGTDTSYGTTVPAVPGTVLGSTDTAVSAAITGLLLGNTYHYRVKAVSLSGTTYGADMTFTTTTYPVAVTEAATAVGATSATLNGTTNANGDPSVNVRIYYSTVNPPPDSSFSAVDQTISGTDNIAVGGTITGLIPNTTYYYQCVAVNSRDPAEATSGQVLSFTTLPADTPPTAVTGSASAVGATTATVNGTVNANNTTTTVTFQYGLDTNYGHTAIADQSPVTGSTDTGASVDISDLSPTTTYTYRVVAQNTGNTVNGLDMTFTTAAAPPIATTDAASAVSSTGATLNGTVNANNDNTTVTFEYGTTTAYGTTVTADQSPVTGGSNTAVSKAITGLTNNTTYHYRVVAQNGSGTTYGSDMTFYTGATAPTVTTAAASSIGPASATLNGTVNANNDSTTVTFQYGLDTGYGKTVPADQGLASGSSDVAATSSIIVNNNTTYHFRVVGQNTAGTAYGDDMTFATGLLFDYGDAPDPNYPTLGASTGASHVLGNGVYLGACVDGEEDGQPTAGADGDDANVGASVYGTCTGNDDEDGVTFTSPLCAGATADVDVVANAACTLSAWIDFNSDGDWADAGEEIFSGQALAAGTNSLSFPVPAGAVVGATYARFRCTTDGAVAFTGQASDGEVEDYQVTIPSSVQTATGTGTASFESDKGVIKDLAAVAEATLPATGKPNLNFSHGFFSFNVTGLTAGETVVVTITLPSAVPVGTTYWKYHASEGGWIQIPMGSDNGDNVITITLVDGGLGDNDGLPNGVIVDPGGPGQPPPVGGIVVPVNRLELLAPWMGLVALAGLAILGVALVRRRRSS